MSQLIAQTRPASTAAATLYTSTRKVDAIQATSLVVCNTSEAEASFRLFHPRLVGGDNDEDSALFYDVPIPANGTEVLELSLWLTLESPTLAVRSSVASALTFTLYGG